MGFYATGGSGDVLSGLINLLADPDKAAAKLKEIQDASASCEAAFERLRKAEAELSAQKGAFEIEKSLFGSKEKALEDAIANAEIAEKNALKKVADLAKAKKDLDALKKEFEDEKANALANLQAMKSDSEAYRRQLEESKNELDKKSLALNTRESQLNNKEANVNALAEEYKAKLAKLKTLVD